jgi:hypothetical protein
MERCPRCTGFGSPIGRFGRLVWLVCRTCRVEFAIDQADYQKEVH